MQLVLFWNLLSPRLCGFIYMYIYIWVYVYVHIYIYIYIYMGLCICTYILWRSLLFLRCSLQITYCMFVWIFLSVSGVKCAHRLHPWEYVKLIAFELAAKFSRRRENPAQPRLCNAKNAISKRLITGFSLRSRSLPANSNALSFIYYFSGVLYPPIFLA